MTEQPKQGDRGRGTTLTPSDVPQDAPPAEAVPSQNAQSHDRRVSDASVAGGRNGARRHSRRRSRSASIPRSFSEVHITIPEPLTCVPGHTQTGPATVSERSSNETSTAAESEEDVPTTIFRTASGAVRFQKRGSSHADRNRRESRTSLSEHFGYQTLPATQERALRNASRRDSSQLRRRRKTANASRLGRLLTPRRSADLSQTRESFVDHPDTSEAPVQGPVAHTKSSLSAADAGSYLSGADTLGGATHLTQTQVMQSSLHDLVSM
ncbi:uncharacterized protein LOC142813892 [Rhipicephalus microplus]|uniref:uncharacterized protein LOC142813892 n=1 Tax=Rhipicephalus microplus TaxID=6941 RepID=UPI003F6A91AF